MITPRNPIFRPRKVTIKLFTNPVTIPMANNPVSNFTLTEVSSIEFSSTSATVVAPGVVTAIIQPWYFQPVMLTITGRAYVGTFGRGAFGVNGTDIMADQDAGKIIELRQIVNQKFFHSFETIRGLSYLLSYEDPEDTENLSVSQTFLGFISEINLVENDSDPYVRTYRIRFVGEDVKLIALLNGTNKRESDFTQAGKRKSDKVESNSRDNAKNKLANQDVETEQDDIVTNPETGLQSGILGPEFVSDDGFRVAKQTRLITSGELKTETIRMDPIGDGKERIIKKEETTGPRSSEKAAKPRIPLSIRTSMTEFQP